jgi:hypothetical protein
MSDMPTLWLAASGETAFSRDPDVDIVWYVRDGVAVPEEYEENHTSSHVGLVMIHNVAPQQLP